VGDREERRTRLVSAALDGHADVAEQLLVHHNEYGAMSVLYGAAGVAHDPETTRLLLVPAGRAPATTRLSSGFSTPVSRSMPAASTGGTALHYAALWGRATTAARLVARGADPEAWSAPGPALGTPLPGRRRVRATLQRSRGGSTPTSRRQSPSRWPAHG
jgi:hypothetical protein